MPFTPSHVAAALPFLRTPLLPAAVVVGTVTPDIPYYVPLFVPRDLSHSILGAVTIDLALALVSVMLWWLLLREPVIDLLPRGIGQRIAPAARFGWRPARRGWPLTAVVLVVSVEVGIATHLLWDSFTHPGWVVDHLTVLRTQLGPLAVEKWLQHASSVFGLVVLAIWSTQWWRRTDPDPERTTRLNSRRRVLGQAAFVSAGVVSGFVAWISGIAAGTPAFDPALVFRVARIGIGVALAVAVVLIIIWFVAGRSPSPRPASGPSLSA